MRIYLGRLESRRRFVLGCNTSRVFLPFLMIFSDRQASLTASVWVFWAHLEIIDRPTSWMDFMTWRSASWASIPLSTSWLNFCVIDVNWSSISGFSFRASILDRTAQRHVIFFVSSLPNSTHVLKSTSAKLKNIGKSIQYYQFFATVSWIVSLRTIQQPNAGRT